MANEGMANVGMASAIVEDFIIITSSLNKESINILVNSGEKKMLAKNAVLEQLLIPDTAIVRLTKSINNMVATIWPNADGMYELGSGLYEMVVVKSVVMEEGEFDNGEGDGNQIQELPHNTAVALRTRARLAEAVSGHGTDKKRGRGGIGHYTKREYLHHAYISEPGSPMPNVKYDPKNVGNARRGSAQSAPVSRPSSPAALADRYAYVIFRLGRMNANGKLVETSHGGFSVVTVTLKEVDLMDGLASVLAAVERKLRDPKCGICGWGTKFSLYFGDSGSKMDDSEMLKDLAFWQGTQKAKGHKPWIFCEDADNAYPKTSKISMSDSDDTPSEGEGTSTGSKRRRSAAERKREQEDKEQRKRDKQMAKVIAMALSTLEQRLVAVGGGNAQVVEPATKAKTEENEKTSVSVVPKPAATQENKGGTVSGGFSQSYIAIMSKAVKDATCPVCGNLSEVNNLCRHCQAPVACRGCIKDVDAGTFWRCAYCRSALGYKEFQSNIDEIREYIAKRG